MYKYLLAYFKYLIKFDKVYDTPIEFMNSFNEFQKNFDFINQYNLNELNTHKLELNKFSDVPESTSSYKCLYEPVNHNELNGSHELFE